MARLLYHRRREARSLVHPVDAVPAHSVGAGCLSESRHPHGDRHLARRRHRSLRPPDGRGPGAKARPIGVRRQQARRFRQPRHRLPGARARGRLHADDRLRRRLVVKPFLEKGLTFDVMNDLAPVFNIAETPHILVIPASVPAKDIAEFIAYGKAQPKPLHYGSAGFGSPPHLSMELFAQAAGLKMVHVPYKGVGGAMPDLLAGRVQAMSVALGSARAYLKGGQLRPLATGARHRIAGLPDVPTSAEAGLPRWEMSAWFGVFAPRATPTAVVRTLNEKLQEVPDEPKVKARLFDAGAEPIGGSVESFAERFRADHRMWGDFIRETGIRQE